MAKKKEKIVEPEKKYWLHGALLLILAAYLSVCLLGLEVGRIGATAAKILRYLFGYGAVYLPLFLGGGALYLFILQRPFWNQFRFYCWTGTAFFSLLIFHQWTVPSGAEIMPESLPDHGGLLAGGIILLSRNCFGNAGAWIIAISGFFLFSLFSISIFINRKKHHEDTDGRRKTKEEKIQDQNMNEYLGSARPISSEKSLFDFQQAKYPFEEEDFYGKEELNQRDNKGFIEDIAEKIPVFRGMWKRKKEGPVPWEDGYGEYVEAERKQWEVEKQRIREMDIQPEFSNEWELDRSLDHAPSIKRKAHEVQSNSGSSFLPKKNVNVEKELDSIESAFVAKREEEIPEKVRPKKIKPYQLPPLSILRGAGKKENVSKLEVRDKAALLKRTLEEFGVRAQVVDYSQGPTVTRFELELAPGVKVNKILNLTDDLALKLATSGIRIEAPIPGKAAVGIEVPNRSISSVSLKEVLDTAEFKEKKSRLSVGLGKDIAGQPVIADLAGMPHLLVAGATGSGKSVCINTIITSILFNALPTEVKFILVDPKMVELTQYNNIPHLLTPVVNDPKQAAAALRWAVREMERRYALLAAASVRDIGRYNELAENHQQEKMPQIVVIIDELADLMMVTPVEVQEAIIRLAQKARAAGIHLILATQRPSVDVITGLIKANVPSRISFAVSSQIDSRTILDMGGAEKLLGKGDMLFFPSGMPKPIRVQGAFISDDEIERLLEYIKNQNEDDPEYIMGITADTEESGGNAKEVDDRDELWQDALRIIMETGQASTSMLQRRFRIGFSRAGRLIDQMEILGIIGPSQGSKPRELLMSPDQIYQKFFQSATE